MEPKGLENESVSTSGNLGDSPRVQLGRPVVGQGQHKWNSFVALGDSFTEGLEDRRSDGGFRGWADLVAAGLSETAHDPETFRYANLAVRGRKMPQIVAEQVPPAVEMKPDLVSLVGGVNDLLRPSFDLEQSEILLGQAVAGLRATGADVLLLVGANPAAQSPKLVALMKSRLDGLNAVISRVADEHGCLTLDLRDENSFEDSRQWADDRLHLSSLGHERMASAFLEALGLGDGAWRERLPELAGEGVVDRVTNDTKWVTQYLAPWIGRRILGRSSGDGLDPKRPHLQTLAAVPLGSE